MGMYTCSRCSDMKDNDWSPCIEDPRDTLGLICEDCACEFEGEAEDRAAQIAKQHQEWLKGLEYEAEQVATHLSMHGERA